LYLVSADGVMPSAFFSIIKLHEPSPSIGCLNRNRDFISKSEGRVSK
jgi:hypothetical protein